MGEPDNMFSDRERVAQELGLPAVVPYSFIGSATPQYHARVEAVMVEIVGEENIRARSLREGGGRFTAYRFEIFHTSIDEVEEVYRRVAAIEGTRMVL